MPTRPIASTSRIRCTSMCALTTHLCSYCNFTKLLLVHSEPQSVLPSRMRTNMRACYSYFGHNAGGCGVLGLLVLAGHVVTAVALLRCFCVIVIGTPWHGNVYEHVIILAQRAHDRLKHRHVCVEGGEGSLRLLF